MWRILVVDDEKSIRTTLGSFLSAEGYAVETAAQYDEAIDLFSNNEYDLVVSDIILGSRNGVELLHAVKQSAPECPVILITGNPSLDTATDGLRRGAFDYLQKPVQKRPFLEVAKRALDFRALQRRNKLLEQELKQHRERLEEKVITQTYDLRRTNEALRKSEERYRTLVATIPEIIAELDLKLNILWLNEVGQEFFGHNVIAQPFIDCTLSPEDYSFFDSSVSRLLSGEKDLITIECMHTNRSAEQRCIEWTCKLLKDLVSNTVGIFCTGRDITEKQKLEEQIHRSSRLQAIGQLSGGVAHDFNNILAAILAQANLLSSWDVGPDKVRESAKFVEAAVRRAQDLTSKLLGFARGGKRADMPVDLHECVRDTIALIDRTIDKRIVVQDELGAKLSVVKGDASQLHQVILNLAVNARDAIIAKPWQGPEPARICFRSETVNVSNHLQRDRELNGASYIKLSVIDSGSGISADVKQHMFEPFFTTKEHGKGTGLGLSLVQTIVKEHHGFIEVSSELGIGSSFDIYLPLFEDKAITRVDEDQVSITKGCGEILVVDDEELVRRSNQQLLCLLGYEVYTAVSGLDALQVLKQRQGKISAVILDVMMPGISAAECFKELRKISPNIPVILTSGYGLTSETQEIIKSGAQAMLQKPFSLGALSGTVARALAK